jgi:hypothetical protein
MMMMMMMIMMMMMMMMIIMMMMMMMMNKKSFVSIEYIAHKIVSMPIKNHLYQSTFFFGAMKLTTLPLTKS